MTSSTQNTPLPRPKGHWPCICGSGQSYRACCRPWHLGAHPTSAEALMRARFAAYAWGKLTFIMDTTHPSCPEYRDERDAWWSDLAQHVLACRYDHLLVESAHEAGDSAQVAFAASGMQGGERVVLRERSSFVREAGRWLYRSGEQMGDAATGA